MPVLINILSNRETKKTRGKTREKKKTRGKTREKKKTRRKTSTRRGRGPGAETRPDPAKTDLGSVRRE